jgi:hypothetical protein
VLTVTFRSWHGGTRASVQSRSSDSLSNHDRIIPSFFRRVLVSRSLLYIFIRGKVLELQNYESAAAGTSGFVLSPVLVVVDSFSFVGRRVACIRKEES